LAGLVEGRCPLYKQRQLRPWRHGKKNTTILHHLGTVRAG